MINENRQIINSFSDTFKGAFLKISNGCRGPTRCNGPDVTMEAMICRRFPEGLPRCAELRSMKFYPRDGSREK
jgi:hypothetical protein